MHTPNPDADLCNEGDRRERPVFPDPQEDIVSIAAPTAPGRRNAGRVRLMCAGHRKALLPNRAFLAMAAIAVLTTLSPRDAQAEIVLTQRGCMVYATWSGDLVWARGLGADKDRARAELVMLDKKQPESIYTLMLREFEPLWATSASREDVTALVLQDCLNRGGHYEDAT
jgi:hypothetical protein